MTYKARGTNFQAQRIELKSTITLSGVFSANFEMLGNAVKNCLLSVFGINSQMETNTDRKTEKYNRNDSAN